MSQFTHGEESLQLCGLPVSWISW